MEDMSAWRGLHAGGCRHVSSGSPQPNVARLEARGSLQLQSCGALWAMLCGPCCREWPVRVWTQAPQVCIRALWQQPALLDSSAQCQWRHMSHDQQAEALARLFRWTCCIVC